MFHKATEGNRGSESSENKPLLAASRQKLKGSLKALLPSAAASEPHNNASSSSTPAAGSSEKYPLGASSARKPLPLGDEDEASLSEKSVNLRETASVGITLPKVTKGHFIQKTLQEKLEAATKTVPTFSSPERKPSSAGKLEWDPKELFDTAARCLLSPSEPIYLIFLLILLLFLFICCQFFGVFIVWGCTLLLLYIISMHQSIESRAEFFKQFLKLTPHESVATKRHQSLEELEWVNRLLHQFWVSVAPDLCNDYLMKRAHLIIDKALPNAFKKLNAKISIKEINMGTTAPLVTVLDTEVMDPTRPNRIILNVNSRWVSAEDTYLLLDIGYMMLHFLVRVDSFVVNMQLKIVLLADTKGGETELRFSVLNQDAVEMPAIKPMGVVPDVVMLPLRKWINKIVGKNINDLLGYPQYLRLSLKELSSDAFEEDPITDISVVYTDVEQKIPNDYILLGKTVTGYAANLNSGRVGQPNIYLCYKRSKTEKPITDIAVIFRNSYKQKLGEPVPPDFEVISKTLVNGIDAQLNPDSGREIYLAIKRGEGPPITNLGVFFADRDEEAAPGYFPLIKTVTEQWVANLNTGTDKSSARQIFLCYKGGNPPNGFKTSTVEPITELSLILVDMDEKIPDGFNCIETTYTNAYPADLNSRHTLTKFNPLNIYKSKTETYLCYRRGGKEKPITEVAIVFADPDKKDAERKFPQGELAFAQANGWTLLTKSATGKFTGNLNRDVPGAREIYIAYKRGDGPPIMDLSLYFKGKEPEPPASSGLNVIKNTITGSWKADLNAGTWGREMYLCYRREGNVLDQHSPGTSPRSALTGSGKEDLNKLRGDDKDRILTIGKDSLNAQSRFSRIANYLSSRKSDDIAPVSNPNQPEQEEAGVLNRFVSGVVRRKNRIKRAGASLLGAERKLTERDKSALVVVVRTGDVNKLKEKMHELGIESLTDVPIAENAPHITTGGNWLHIAATATRGAAEVISFLLDCSTFDINQPSVDGWTPLHVAAHEGDLDACSVLLVEGASPITSNKDGVLPLHFLVMHNYSEKLAQVDDVLLLYTVLTKLSKEGKLINAVTSQGEAPIHFASKKPESLAVARMLLLLGANPRLIDKRGNTPLHSAILSLNVPLVVQLLENGADIDAVISSPQCLDIIAKTPEFTLISAKFAQLTEEELAKSREELLKDVFDNLCRGDGYKVAKLLEAVPNVSMDEISPPPTYPVDGRTWLHLAAYEGNIPVIRALSKASNIPINAYSKLGKTPLHEAASTGHWTTIVSLIKAGANPSLVTEPDHDLAIHLAAEQKLATTTIITTFVFIRAFYLLSDHASLVNQPNKKDEAPLHRVKKNGLQLNLILLLHLGAYPNQSDIMGRTPFVNAITCGKENKGKVDLVAALLKYGAEPEPGALELAKSSNPQIFALLMKYKTMKG